MIILTVTPDKKAKGKIKICLDNGADFVLYRKEANRFQLEEGKELTEETYQKILEEIWIPRAKKRAMHLLEQMDRTEYQLRSKLKENGYPEEAVEEALVYVKSFHYVDDERYARNFVRIYGTQRSKMRLKQDLTKKGIDREVIAVAIEEELERSEAELIQGYLKKKNYDPNNADRKTTEKMYRFLAQKGFQTGDIIKALHEGENDV